MEETMASWRRYEASDNDGIGSREIEALIDTADAANWEAEDFELGEPWTDEQDPAEDDDPE
jgi:hypothetical protein